MRQKLYHKTKLSEGETLDCRLEGSKSSEHGERGNSGIKDASDEALDRNNILAQDEGDTDYLKT